MKSLSKIFLAGLAAVVPIVITIYILYWLGSSAERLFGGMLKFILPASVYWPGMGLAIGIGVIFLVGLFMRAWIVQKLFQWAESLVTRIPFVKTVYGSAKDLIAFVTSPKEREFNQVVAITLPNTQIRLLGFITREDVHHIAAGLAPEGNIAVYLPMSYQIGGYTVFVPRSTVEPVDMSMNDAMRFAITAGMSTSSTRAPEAMVE
ncbi:MAG TPA: DUF502 domain-containing protein [Gammaproteobacteria bacterium]|nr:DUF502 domain-containing protein [Gammaproteobacteria bacterium]